MSGLPVAEGGAVDEGRLGGAGQGVHAGVGDQSRDLLAVKIIAISSRVGTRDIAGDHVNAVLLDDFLGRGHGVGEGDLLVGGHHGDLAVAGLVADRVEIHAHPVCDALAQFGVHAGVGKYDPDLELWAAWTGGCCTAASREHRRAGHRHAELQELAAVYVGPQLVVEVTLDRVRHVTPPFS